ncbi:NAD(P)/FAD-dependent oxidoreductase [Gaetbulibacter aestuarii]|uniref:FAD-dependent oxidoreductase n=1 Tax=Gaetbulibacter aestuarii TaxID=1502358 RepID=A0ABW7MZR8_9FLAO
MNLSYWEIQTWLKNIDFTVIGSGIVGLNCALQLKQKHPKSRVLVLEKGMLPQGASTKNAGFACFGSLSEIIEDLKSHSEEEVLKLIQKRLDGLHILRQNLGDDTIGYKQHGGYELFTKADAELYEICLDQRDTINRLLEPILKDTVFQVKPNNFNFQNIQENLIYNPFEGQIHTGNMMEALLHKAQSAGIKILNNCVVENFSEDGSGVHIKTDQFQFRTGKLCIATNGFASQFIKEEVKPARAQVLITKPIKKLHIKGTFHLDKGFYYFRNINDRILFGGGRNLDFKGEETTRMEQTELIQNELERLLKTTILPHTDFEIDHRWSGIMGVGSKKEAIVKPLSDHVFCGVRLGGMGVAIGSLVGKELADLATL